MLAEQQQRLPGLVRDLAERISYPKLAHELGLSEADLRAWEQGKHQFSLTEAWRLFRSTYKYGFFDVLPAHGILPVSYNIGAPFDITAAPLAFEQKPPTVSLRKQETTIAGYRVDFPLGLPASILASNAKWIEFYARRGFDILTYKTVRTRYRREHFWPNWVFLEDAPEIDDPLKPPVIVGYPGYWPDDPKQASMANSFGVPSLDPTWWREDVRRAREFVREGHQVLIVSVIASVKGTLEAIAGDFAEVALLAKEAGADIIEANYSCPNTPVDRVGEIYQSPKAASLISEAIRGTIGNTPLFTKIGYLPKPVLREFVERNAKYIDGIVAINTISARIVPKPEHVGTAKKILEYVRALNQEDSDQQTFPGEGRDKAGVSGWAIKARAREVAENLVLLRKEIRGREGNPLAILGVGGVLTAQDYFERLRTGVDAVETCTGAFLNPSIGLEIRSEDGITDRPEFVSIAR